MNIYFDTEFTGLQKNTTLISIGLVAENGNTFYAELNDFDKTQVTPWIQEHVIANLVISDDIGQQLINTFKGNKECIKIKLKCWLQQFDKVEIWSDCLAYDWVLFCDIFGSAFEVPSNVYYIPFDLCTAMRMAGVDPDINREEYSELTESAQKHNALWDAKVIKACHDKLKRNYVMTERG